MAGVKGRSGRKPKTTATLRKEGGYKDCRHADRADNHADPAGWPVRPGDLTHSGDLWRKVCEYFQQMGMIGELDGEALAEFCRSYDFMTEARILLQANVIDKDARIAYCHYHDKWFRLGREFGFTPLSRSGIKVPAKSGEEESDPFEILTGRYGIN